MEITLIAAVLGVVWIGLLYYCTRPAFRNLRPEMLTKK
jgi:hypothetical protein